MCSQHFSPDPGFLHFHFGRMIMVMGQSKEARQVWRVMTDGEMDFEVPDTAEGRKSLAGVIEEITLVDEIVCEVKIVRCFVDCK